MTLPSACDPVASLPQGVSAERLRSADGVYRIQVETLGEPYSRPCAVAQIVTVRVRERFRGPESERMRFLIWPRYAPGGIVSSSELPRLNPEMYGPGCSFLLILDQADPDDFLPRMFVEIEPAASGFVEKEDAPRVISNTPSVHHVPNQWHPWKEEYRQFLK